ncbi:MAG: DUF2071 domain-containing protein [Gemmatimonadales bacterium]
MTPLPPPRPPPPPFLTARWSDLVLVTYDVPEEVVRRDLPAALEPDRWEGRTYVNLVALHVGEIRVRGWRFPWLGGFAQLNLRALVRHRGEPGVLFVRQLVPNALVAVVSRLRYRQPAAVLPMTYVSARRDDAVTAEYLLDRPPRGCVIVTGSGRAAVPPASTFEHFCKERVWGFGRTRGRRLVRFRVEHPAWAVREVLAWRLLLDFSAFFGPAWRFLNDAKPVSVTFAVGSEVAVYPPTDSTSTTPSP